MNSRPELSLRDRSDGLSYLHPVPFLHKRLARCTYVLPQGNCHLVNVEQLFLERRIYIILHEVEPLYEPVHGSAPDIAGQDKANPLATILSVAMMFRYAFGRKEAGALIEQAVLAALEQGFRTPDLRAEGARFVGTKAMGNCVLDQIDRIRPDGR